MGTGFRVFIGLGSRLARETERDTGFQFQRDFIISNAKPEAGVGPSNGYVPCQVLSSVSIVAYPFVSIRPYEVFGSYCDLFC